MGEPTATLEHAIDAAIAALAAPLSELVPAAVDDARYIELLTRVEALGRLVDAARVRLAGDAAERAGGAIDTFGALGYRSAVDAIAALTGISEVTARRRIRTGEAIVPRLSLTGAVVTPRRPAIANAVSAGALGVEAAAVLVAELDAVSARVDAVDAHEAEEGLVALAASSAGRPPLCVDLVRVQAKAYVAVLDPDGARPREERMVRRRAFSIGREDEDGLIPVRGRLTTEAGTQLRRLVDATMRSVSFGNEPSASDTRTREQKRHDAVAAIVGAAARVSDAPDLAGASPAVIVTVTREALATGRGVGFIDGAETPISLPTVERLIDAGGIQTVTRDESGRILSLGSVQRCFTASQRRAITARDGGCIIPGCPIPAGWCEIHHVIPHRDGGATHVENGVLLCWWHHHRIDSGPWRIRMVDGVPHVRGPAHHEWTRSSKSRVTPPRHGSVPHPSTSAPPPPPPPLMAPPRASAPPPSTFTPPPRRPPGPLARPHPRPRGGDHRSEDHRGGDHRGGDHRDRDARGEGDADR